MIESRPFRNTDIPLLVDVWRSQPQQRGLMQPMSAALFDQLVLSKPYFEAGGLIVAIEDGRGLGFVHVGFGPSPSGEDPSPVAGVISLLLVRQEAYPSLALELLHRGERRLREQSVHTIYVHGARSCHPFYLGLYGGSEILGTLASDPNVGLYTSEGYAEFAQASVMHIDLARFRPVVDRRQMQLRRRLQVEIVTDPEPKSWWEACTYGGFDRVRFEVQPRGGGAPVASAMTWNMAPLASTWGVHAAGLLDVEVSPGQHRGGTATFLLGEAFKHLQALGVSIVEAQIPDQNSAARLLFKKLGFDEVDRSLTLCKRV